MSPEENKAIIDGGKSMSDEERTDPNRDDLRAVYQQLCDSYRAIDDFRAKLLGFLPLATGAGIFLLLTDPKIMDVVKQFLLPIGVFGFVVTLGLFCYEIYGIRKCGALIGAGKQLERLLRIKDGQFTERPREVVWFINEPFAAGIIYPAVLAAWMYLALVYSRPQAAQWAPVLVFFVGFALTLIYDLWLRWRDMLSLEKLAAGIIYPAVLAACTYLALVYSRPQAAQWAAIRVFIAAGFALTLILIYNLLLRKGDKSRACKQSGRTHKEGDSAA